MDYRDTPTELEAALPELFALGDAYAHVSAFFDDRYDFDDLLYRAALALWRGEGLEAALAHLTGCDEHPAAPGARELLTRAAQRPLSPSARLIA